MKSNKTRPTVGQFNHLTFCATLIATFCLLGSPRVSHAQVNSVFPQGTFVLSSYASYAHSFDGERVMIGTFNIGAGYYIFKNFGFNLEASYQRHDQRGPNADVMMIDMLFRHHLFHYGRASFFIDFGLGVSYANARTPHDGTYFNFMEEAGVGSTFQIKDNIHLISAVRFFHMSNARIDGPERNPSINSTQVYLGVLFKI
jgi:hypothetical protein